MTTFGPTNTLGPYLPNSQTFSEDEDQFLVQITSRDRDIARHINIREIASYDLVEIPTGQQWFTTGNPQIKRGGFRKVFSFGAVSAGASLVIPIGVPGIVMYTHIYGAATTTTASGGSFYYVPLPYTNTSGSAFCIDLRINDTNIEIIAGASLFSLSGGVVILEYLKN